MKALFERFNRSRQPPSPTHSQQTNFPPQRGHTFVNLSAAIRDGQLLPSSRFRRQIESALQDYERQTGFNLVDHPLAKRFQGCTSVEDAVDILREQAQGIDDFHGDNYDGKLMRSLNGVVCVLHKLYTSTVLCEVTGLPLHPKEAVLIGLAILFATVKSVNSDYDTLIDFLETIERIIARLDVYTAEVVQRGVVDEFIVRIIVELLSTLAVVTKQVKHNRPIISAKTLLRGKQVEVVLQRLDRLTPDEVCTTAVQILDVVYNLIQNMRVVMDGSQASIDNIRDSLELLQQFASGLNSSRREKIQQDLRTWLLPPDPWKNHNIACELRLTGTSSWFIQGDTLSEWKSSGPSSLLWIHSKPGGGKSVLCSAIIQDIDVMRKSGLASLAFYYCDFREDPKKDRHGLLASMLAQLCLQSDAYCDFLSKFMLEHARGSRQPSDDVLATCLKDLIKIPGQASVYLIVDALDECPNTSAMPSAREKVLILMEELVDSGLPNLHICVTSRPEPDIKAVLDPLTFRSVSLQDESGQMGDIDYYIQWVVHTDPHMRRWNAEHKQLVIDVLTKTADGMFRWVYCQILHLRGCLPGHIQHALIELPETLDETYERTLREISHANWEFAHRLFQCVSVASRPLRVEELADLLAFDFKARPIPRFHENWRLKDPVHTVLSTCSSLLAIVNIEGSPVMQFSHSSVKDFLTLARLAETSDIIIRRYHISMTPAHSLAAQACLGILLHLDGNITRDFLQKFPLAEYAASHWLDHARFENVLPTLDHGMKLLFNPNKPHLAAWLWLYDPTDLWHVKRGERLPHLGTSLHYVAICGFHTMVKHLVTEHSQDVNACVFYKMSTPLHWASYKGYVKVVRYLLEHGANVTARCVDGSMPLHWASKKGRVKVIRVLLQHKADANAQIHDRSTPLHHASSRGHVNSVRIFLEHGADAIAQDKNGWTPLHWAAFEGHAEVTRVLLGHGVDTSMRDRDGRTPLHHASSEGNLEVTRVLLEHGVYATAQDSDGRTPLHRTSFRGHVETVRLLLQQGVDVIIQDKSGCTPLHYASLAGHLEVVRVLLEHGADPTAKNKKGRTPSSFARRNGNSEIVRIISRYESDAGTQAGKDVLSVRTKYDSESKANVEGRTGSQAGNSLLTRVIDWNGINPREGINGARSSGSSDARTSPMLSLYTARTTLGRPSTMSKGSQVASMSSDGPSNAASTSGGPRPR